jgi:hypothetical protein
MNLRLNFLRQMLSHQFDKTPFPGVRQTGSRPGLSIDAKKYFVNTTLHVRNAAGTEVLQTEHKIAPWVVSAGVAYRF